MSPVPIFILKYIIAYFHYGLNDSNFVDYNSCRFYSIPFTLKVETVCMYTSIHINMLLLVKFLASIKLLAGYVHCAWYNVPPPPQNGMIPLYGAVLHKCVDVEGQAIGSDLQSGRSEDKLAFGLSLVNNDNLYLRAARPNEWKQWVELLEKVINIG